MHSVRITIDVDMISPILNFIKESQLENVAMAIEKADKVFSDYAEMIPYAQHIKGIKVNWITVDTERHLLRWTKS